MSREIIPLQSLLRKGRGVVAPSISSYSDAPPQTLSAIEHFKTALRIASALNVQQARWAVFNREIVSDPDHIGNEPGPAEKIMRSTLIVAESRGTKFAGKQLMGSSRRFVLQQSL
jgi:hypothetical protein